jgi:cytochrome P450
VTGEIPIDANALYRPPAPAPLSALAALARTVLRGEQDLLSLLPAEAYSKPITPLGFSRRSILLVNDPAVSTEIFADAGGVYPKNDLMVGALEPLVGNSMFVSSGEIWRRQRRMIDPAFSHMRINRAFDVMAATVDDYENRLDEVAGKGETISLDAAMSHLTADIVCRTIFSKSLESRTARDVFDNFLVFERHVANVELGRLIFGKPFAQINQSASVLEACARIRRHIGDLVDPRLAAGAAQIDDIAGAVIAAQDPQSGLSFTREELIDQIGVFFLAGHETTASALTWVFFILSMRPEIVARMRAEIARVSGDGPVEFEHAKQMVFVRNVFRETLRLYPPITFLPRVAACDTTIAGRRIKRGAMVMLAPWATHRNAIYWKNADRFDPDRFAPENEKNLVPGTYMPFGLGQRICVGAAFATFESCLILARLVRRYDFETLAPEKVRPVARLTTRPAREISVRVRRR